MPDPQSIAPSTRRLDPDALQRLQRRVRDEVERGRLPGAVILLWHDGRLAFEWATGRQDPQAGTPMALDSIFRIYSMTKPIVSVALMQQVERGQVLLGDPVSRHLPEFGGVTLGVVATTADGTPELRRAPVAKAPTVHDLLRHTAGLTYGMFGDAPVHRAYMAAGVERGTLGNADLSRRLAELPLAYEPGTVWEYSRATDVVGALVERVAGRSLGEVLRDEILAPLAMRDTAFWVRPDARHRLAEPHPRDPDSGSAVRLLDATAAPVFESGGGGLVGTAHDYLRFCRMLLGGGELDGMRLLSRKTVEFMTSDHLGADLIRASRRPGANGGYLPGPGYGFGLGLAVRLADGEAETPGSAGEIWWAGLGGTSFFIDPRERLIAIWMGQAPGQRGDHRALFRNLVHAALV